MLSGWFCCLKSHNAILSGVRRESNTRGSHKAKHSWGHNMEKHTMWEKQLPLVVWPFKLSFTGREFKNAYEFPADTYFTVSPRFPQKARKTSNVDTKCRSANSCASGHSSSFTHSSPLSFPVTLLVYLLSASAFQKKQCSSKKSQDPLEAKLKILQNKKKSLWMTRKCVNIVNSHSHWC